MGRDTHSLCAANSNRKLSNSKYHYGLSNASLPNAKGMLEYYLCCYRVNTLDIDEVEKPNWCSEIFIIIPI